MGFNADIAIKGVGSSLSVNGGKTNLNADYKGIIMMLALLLKKNSLKRNVYTGQVSYLVQQVELPLVRLENWQVK